LNKEEKIFIEKWVHLMLLQYLQIFFMAYSDEPIGEERRKGEEENNFTCKKY
jgi:hypothetical protein